MACLVAKLVNLATAPAFASTIYRRALSTTCVSLGTGKRRKTYPFFWLQDKEHKYYAEHLTKQNEKFIDDFVKNKYSLSDSTATSPLKAQIWTLSDEEKKFDENVARTGLICKKIGVYPMWTNTGRRLLTTLLQVADNHVIKYHSPDEWKKICRPFDREKSRGLGCVIVGADSRDPQLFTSEYNGLFKESGVMPKQKLTRFFISHNARIQPGTPLLASHFRPGMYVDIYGKTIDWGLQGVRFRWKMKGGPKTHGTTKAHNRVGSIGRGRKHPGPMKGKRMPGHDGAERKIFPGLLVWRINTKYNCLWVQGPAVPGRVGDYVNVMDSRLFEKRPSFVCSPEMLPPLPTISIEDNNKLDEELYHPELHRFDAPTLIFRETEAERKAAASLAARGGKTAKTAQKVR